MRPPPAALSIVETLVLPMAMTSLALRGAIAQEPAEFVVLDAVVHTVDEEIPRAEAFAVAGGRIVAVGSNEEVRARVGPGTTVHRAGGAAVIPGLIDAHAHVMGLGAALRTLDLVGTDSPDEIAEKVRAVARDREPGAWILGRGWDQNDWPEDRREFPGREILDAAAPGHPVALTRVDGHAVWANSRALEAAGITAATEDPPGGRVVRDEWGEPTGVLIDNAQGLLRDSIPPPDEAELEARLAAARDHMAEVGLTGVHDMGVGRPTLELYRRWADAGRLGPRIVAYLTDDNGLIRWWTTGGARAVAGDEGRFRVVGVKLYADGALGSRGAALIQPYADDPGNSGLLVTDADTLAAHTARAMRLGLQPAIHAIGDRGNQVALDAIAYGEDEVAGLTATSGPLEGGEEGKDADRSAESGLAAGRLGPRIEHAQVIAIEDVPRFVELGVTASVQPTHATSDMYWAEDRLGPERIVGAYAWRTLREAGVSLACGSDFPVENANPFHGLYAAVTRTDREGWPEGGWRPAERMTREEALACFTLAAAAAAGMDDDVGSIAVGKQADFVLLDGDPMTLPESELWRITAVWTVIGGETAFGAPPPGESRSR